MIVFNGKQPVSIFLDGKSYVYVYYKDKLVWGGSIKSCFANGYWVDENPWTDDQPWKD